MIRNAANGMTGGIGPVRYVENGKTVNIPIGYVVESGKTVLMYGQKITGQPSGEYVYLYQEGVTSDLVGGWKIYGSADNPYFTFTENESYLSFYFNQGNLIGDYAYVCSKNIVDISNYHRMCFAVECIGEIDSNWLRWVINSTVNDLTCGGALPRKTDSDSEDSIVDLKYKNGFIKFTLENTTNPVMSTVTDVEYRIHAIWLERTPEPEAEIANAKVVSATAISNMVVTNDTDREDINNTVSKALKAAGIMDVDAHVSGFVKTTATTNNAGSLEFTLELFCAGVIDETDYTKEIARLTE